MWNLVISLANSEGGREGGREGGGGGSEQVSIT